MDTENNLQTIVQRNLESRIIVPSSGRFASTKWLWGWGSRLRVDTPTAAALVCMLKILIFDSPPASMLVSPRETPSHCLRTYCLQPKNVRSAGLAMQWRSVDPSELLQETCKHPLLRDAEPGHCFLSFRAGLLSLLDGKLKSDKRKGQVLLLQSEEPGFVNIQWCQRDVDESSGVSTLQNSALIDQMVFEGEAQISWVGPKERRVLRVVFSEVRSSEHMLRFRSHERL